MEAIKGKWQMVSMKSNQLNKKLGIPWMVRRVIAFVTGFVSVYVKIVPEDSRWSIVKVNLPKREFAFRYDGVTYPNLNPIWRHRKKTIPARTWIVKTGKRVYMETIMIPICECCQNIPGIVQRHEVVNGTMEIKSWVIG